MLKNRVATRLDARYARLSDVQKLHRRVADLDRRIAALEESVRHDSADEASPTDLGGEVALLRHQLSELTRLMEKA